MTTIERIYGALVETMTTELPGRRSADPFTFDHDPRDAADSWYIDPPGTESAGAVGGLERQIAGLHAQSRALRRRSRYGSAGRRAMMPRARPCRWRAIWHVSGTRSDRLTWTRMGA